MSNYGVTKDGFKRKTYNEILKDLQSGAKEMFGVDINLSNSSFLGMWLQNMAWEMATMWELAEYVYFSSFIDFNEGLSQDGTGKYIAITRKPAQYSKGEITIEGNEGTRISKGFRLANKDLDIIFETAEGGVINSSGEIDLPIVSILPGLNQNLPANSLVKMVNPISGVTGLYNKEITIDGADVESDKDFRERYYRSVSRGGSSTRESVEATILDMDEVVDAFVEENETMTYIGDIPPKSIAPYIFGGKDEDVARVILETKAGGIRSYGETELNVEDSKGISHVIGFTRPEVIDVYIRVSLMKDKGYPEDKVVTNAILNYIGGEDEDGIAYKGLSLGEDVVIAKIMSSVMCLQGVKDIEVEISVDDTTYQTNNISIAQKEVARTRYDKVVINYV